MYCVNENKDAKAHFVFFFKFSFGHSYIKHMDISRQSFLSKYLIMKLCVHLQVGKVCK